MMDEVHQCSAEDTIGPKFVFLSRVHVAFHGVHQCSAEDTFGPKSDFVRVGLISHSKDENERS